MGYQGIRMQEELLCGVTHVRSVPYDIKVNFLDVSCIKFPIVACSPFYVHWMFLYTVNICTVN